MVNVSGAMLSHLATIYQEGFTMEPNQYVIVEN